MLEKGLGRVEIGEDRNGCEGCHRKRGLFGDGDKLLGVIEIPLWGMSALLRVWHLLLVQRAFRGMPGGVVRDGDAFGTALHAREEQHYAKNRDGAQEWHYILDNSECEEASNNCVFCCDEFWCGQGL